MSKTLRYLPDGMDFNASHFPRDFSRQFGSGGAVSGEPMIGPKDHSTARVDEYALAKGGKVAKPMAKKAHKAPSSKAAKPGMVVTTPQRAAAALQGAVKIGALAGAKAAATGDLRAPGGAPGASPAGMDPAMMASGPPIMAPDAGEQPPVAMKKGGKLTTKARNALSSTSFALPGRRYPINDPNHARNALSRVAQNGTPDEKSRVRAAVQRKYPAIGKKD